MTTEQLTAVEDAVSRAIAKVVMPVLTSVADQTSQILQCQHRLETDIKELRGRALQHEARIDRLEDRVDRLEQRVECLEGDNK